jgi:SH3 domain-containing protein
MPIKGRTSGGDRKNVGPLMEVTGVIEPFSFGTPERRRFAMQFGYDMRPSFWQGVRSNSHLVIAALGTAALLSVAAVALWLALPSNQRLAAASPLQTVPAITVKTTKVVPPDTAKTAAMVPQQVRKAQPATRSKAVEAPATIQALAANDPRWTATKPAPEASPTPDSRPAPASGQVAQKGEEPPISPAAFAQPEAGSSAGGELAKVAPTQPAAANQPDDAKTAAIPSVSIQDTEAAEEPSKAQAEPPKAAAAGNGTIIRAVTMRSGPKKNAAAIVTVPARTSVQVMSCNKWCQIVYNGKTGWIYKSYIKT